MSKRIIISIAGYDDGTTEIEGCGFRWSGPTSEASSEIAKAAIAAERERIRNGDDSHKSQVDTTGWVGEPSITNTIRWLRAECAGENRHAALYYLIAATRDAAVAAERERCQRTARAHSEWGREIADLFDEGE